MNSNQNPEIENIYVTKVCAIASVRGYSNPKAQLIT